MSEFPYNEKYMRRALRLAANGRGYTRSNPMVGAVIVSPDGRVIGEGWHRRYGQGHAEVNAVASVKDADRPLLKDSTMYVTLEPCSHYGKTPPCAKLLVEMQIPRVVVGAGDPNPKVNGRGIAMLREAGTEVISGVLAEESIALNKIFFTSQALHRPFIYLKWAQSADGFMDIKRGAGESAFLFSDAVSRLATMKLRSEFQAIMTTAATFLADHPRLTVRGWEGMQPLRFIYDRSNRLEKGGAAWRNGENGATVATRTQYADFNLISPGCYPSYFSHGSGEAERDSLLAPFDIMYKEFGVTSVLVEAGPRYLNALLEAGLWDELRVEISPVRLGGSGAHPAPSITADCLVAQTSRFSYYRRKKEN